ncbi:hypothetical protein NDU88_004170 [Pleurodeles waltl]|uniref:Uncharacterized protein n=1 Tax=Pleurodeles waltl TaxID=8319 RepID=A0AAV7QBU2_PLEWA|nr:hypothetical protein NDU88_004170 [Pleurodeles waltl]
MGPRSNQIAVGFESVAKAVVCGRGREYGPLISWLVSPVAFPFEESSLSRCGGRIAFTKRSPAGGGLPWCAGPRGESSARRACAMLAAGQESLRGCVAFKKVVPRRQCTQCLLRSLGYGLGSPSG